MKCQSCKINDATTNIKSTINGKEAEYNLCSECATKLGYNNINMFSDFASDFGSLLGSFFGRALPERTEATRCPFCKSSYSEIAKTGLVGCSECYNTFKDQLMPTVKSIHGNINHSGKKPSNFNTGVEYTKTEDSKDSKEETINKVDEKVKVKGENKEEKITNLKEQMDKAVKTQDFEKAAKLRDKIKEIEEMEEEKND